MSSKPLQKKTKLTTIIAHYVDIKPLFYGLCAFSFIMFLGILTTFIVAYVFPPKSTMITAGSTSNLLPDIPLTSRPSDVPTVMPTDSPIHSPTYTPTTKSPTDSPTNRPTQPPTTPIPTDAPTTRSPSNTPTEMPSDPPTPFPTSVPTASPV